LGAELPTPTRVVVRSGRFHRGAAGALGRLPRHATLSDAFAAIAALGPGRDEEVIQIEDSASYSETLVWPTNVERLTVQAAEGERPLLRLSADVVSGPGQLELIRVCGVGFSGADLAFPACDSVELAFVSIAEAERIVSFLSPSDQDCRVQVDSSLLGRLTALGRVSFRVADSVIDAAGGLAVDAVDASLTLERVTILAKVADLPLLGASGPPLAVQVRTLSASEALFAQGLRVFDQFSGCIRYSRVEPGSETPRRHRVVEHTPKFVSLDRNDAAHARLSEKCPRSILVGAEDGSEIGAFSRTQLGQHLAAIHQRVVEFTPAGMRTGLIRVD
jgi:hypothetical protein